jgi:hypothetical protein
MNTNSATATDLPTSSTVYTVTGAGTNNCTSSASVSVFVDPCTSMNEMASSGLQALLYPNPSNGLMRCVTSSVTQKNVIVTSATGQLISDSIVTGTEFMIDLTGKAKGIYFVTVSDGTTNGRYKVIIE